MTANFQETLKALGKQAKKEAAEREAEVKAKKQVEDLHGYTQEEAQQVLNEFIEFTKKRGVCGEIVHGSGLGSAGYKPVLKNMTRRWLMQHPDVLAYVEPRQGNDGAVRILLKRQRRDDDWKQ